MVRTRVGCFRDVSAIETRASTSVGLLVVGSPHRTVAATRASHSARSPTSRLLTPTSMSRLTPPQARAIVRPFSFLAASTSSAHHDVDSRHTPRGFHNAFVSPPLKNPCPIESKGGREHGRSAGGEILRCGYAWGPRQNAVACGCRAWIRTNRAYRQARGWAARCRRTSSVPGADKRLHDSVIAASIPATLDDQARQWNIHAVVVGLGENRSRQHWTPVAPSMRAKRFHRRTYAPCEGIPGSRESW